MSWNIKYLEDSLLIGSTLVEGSTLTESEAHEVLRGRTIVGHPVSEIRELLNYRSAIEWLAVQVEASPYLSEELILLFHRRLFEGFPEAQGQFKSHANYTYRTDGSRHDYTKPSRVKAAIAQWLVQFNELDAVTHAAQKAAKLYYDFENIHPFEDGNGRIGRVLVAYWLHWKSRLRFSFYLKDKLEHLFALEAANQGDLTQLELFFERRLTKEDL